MKTLLLLFYILLFSALSHGQPDLGNDMRQRVLKKAIANKEFTFGNWSEKTDETRLTYLGTVKTRSGKIFKVMNSVWIWGLSQRATSRILIFDRNDHYIGNYAVTMTSDLPVKLENGSLVFNNLDEPLCDNKLSTKIDLRNGIPKEIFLKCKGNYGDFYTFDPGK